MEFSVLDEQKSIFDFFDRQLLANRLSHAFCVETNNYTQTNVFVKELCKRIINSDDDNVNYLIDNDIYPDINIINPDGDFIRKSQLLGVRSEFSGTSLLGTKKIYIITDAARLNESSANTILKFLEEPSDGVYAILLCNNRYQILETLLSRCQILSLCPNNFVDMHNNLSDYDFTDVSEILLSGKNAFLRYSELLEIFNDRKNMVVLLKNLEKYFYNIYRSDTINSEIKIEKSKLFILISVIEDSIQKLAYNLNFKLFLDNFIINLSEVL